MITAEVSVIQLVIIVSEPKILPDNIIWTNINKSAKPIQDKMYQIDIIIICRDWVYSPESHRPRPLSSSPPPSLSETDTSPSAQIHTQRLSEHIPAHHQKFISEEQQSAVLCLYYLKEIFFYLF